MGRKDLEVHKTCFGVNQAGVSKVVISTPSSSRVTGIGGDHNKSITETVRKLPGVSITMVNAYTWALSAITPKRQVTYVMLILSKCLKLKL